MLGRQSPFGEVLPIGQRVLSRGSEAARCCRGYSSGADAYDARASRCAASEERPRVSFFLFLNGEPAHPSRRAPLRQDEGDGGLHAPALVLLDDHRRDVEVGPRHPRLDEPSRCRCGQVAAAPSLRSDCNSVQSDVLQRASVDDGLKPYVSALRGSNKHFKSSPSSDCNSVQSEGGGGRRR